ncbi:carbohydrate ABC transporter permease [Paenibacillus sp. J5C_2022]|uniref:carbohydrate ABC transporter permease n=1 Tax=Paenibacillus sp. J5C2022 TaxID=2977129 RepID=UPI0021D23A80|nr:carbohydrate ABC transporter permease [Paenibacillus sp. J5C2022]MCU6710387.1 carbohydrate ABC transporter permease [Paenibacillus sp. J5C2022]
METYSRGEKAFSFVNYLLLAILCVVMMYPFFYVFLYSISDSVAASGRTLTFFPVKPTLYNYKVVLTNSGIMNAFYISVARTLVGTLAHVIVTTMVAYALSKPYLVARKTLFVFFMIPMFFSGGLLPFYVVVVKLGLSNSFWVYILPALFTTFNMLLAKVFFDQIPKSLEESASIDGAGPGRIFFQIILPSSLPILATLSIFAGVAQWNSWFDALLFVTKQDLLPVQTLLYKIILESQASTVEQIMRMSQTDQQTTISSESIKMTTLMVSTLPILFIYPFMQRYFVKGMMLGAVKG